MTPAVIVVGIEGYLRAVFGTPEWAAPLWWVASYSLFVGINVVGTAASFRFTVLVTLVALAILVVFWIGAVPHMSLDHALEGPRGRSWLPNGLAGVLPCLPFAMWFFLAIEELPLAAEEAHDPRRDLPRGLLLGLLTLVVAGFLTLITAACIAPGTAGLATSDEPLFEGFRTIFGEGIGARLLALLAVAGLVASFHGIVFACGRQIYSLSRAGYFPRWLSLTHARRKTPHVALVVGSMLGLGAAFAIHSLGADRNVAAVLLNMAVFGAVIAYVLQMVSFLVLRRRFPGLERPYRSRLGVVGAWVALALALLTLVTLFLFDPEYARAVGWAAAWYAAGLAYFAFYARHRLVLSPEEEFAVGVRTRDEGHGADA
jgi:ethanolamine permease